MGQQARFQNYLQQQALKKNALPYRHSEEWCATPMTEAAFQAGLDAVKEWEQSAPSKYTSGPYRHACRTVTNQLTDRKFMDTLGDVYTRLAAMADPQNSNNHHYHPSLPTKTTEVIPQALASKVWDAVTGELGVTVDIKQTQHVKG